MVSPYVFYYQLNQGGIIENVMFSFSLFIAENKEKQQQSNKAYLNDVHISPRLINYVDFRRCGLCVFSELATAFIRFLPVYCADDTSTCLSVISCLPSGLHQQQVFPRDNLFSK